MLALGPWTARPPCYRFYRETLSEAFQADSFALQSSRRSRFGLSRCFASSSSIGSDCG